MGQVGPLRGQPGPNLRIQCDTLKTCIRTAISDVLWLGWGFVQGHVAHIGLVFLGPTSAPDAPTRNQVAHAKPNVRPNVLTLRHVGPQLGQAGANWPAFRHRSFCTEMPLQTKAFTHRSFYSEKPLNRATFTHTEAFTQRRFCTEKLFHRQAVAGRNFEHKRFLHTAAFTQRSLCAFAPLRGPAFTLRLSQVCFHRAAFTRSSFHTPKL